jgi:hypothetical protein
MIHPNVPDSAGTEDTRSTDELKETAKQTTTAVASEVRDSLASGVAEVRDQAAERTDDAKQGLAREMSATAQAFDVAEQELEGHTLQRSLFREASRGLAGMAEMLNQQSTSELISGASDFGRRNPVAFIGGAALAGFVLSRLATASEPGPARASSGGRAPRDPRRPYPAGSLYAPDREGGR